MQRERMRVADVEEAGGACGVWESPPGCVRMRLGTQWSWKEGSMEKDAWGRSKRMGVEPA